MTAFSDFGNMFSVLAASALPPIPGSGAPGYTILFAQLGIPLEGMAIALALDTVLDHWNTGMNLSMLRLELVRVAKKLGKAVQASLTGHSHLRCFKRREAKRVSKGREPFGRVWAVAQRSSRLLKSAQR